MAKEVKDFGEKIGGARKDFYAKALCLADLQEMNGAEKQKLVTRDNIWKREDPVAIVRSGIPQEIAYWRNQMRIAFSPKPDVTSEDSVQRYVEVISDIRDHVLSVSNADQMDRFYGDYLKPNYIAEVSSYYVKLIPNAKGIITSKVLKIAQMKANKAKLLAGDYGLTKEEAERTCAEKTYQIVQFGNSVRYDKEGSRPRIAYHYVGVTQYFYMDPGSEMEKESYWKKGTYLIVDVISHKVLTANLDTYETAVALKEEYVKKKLGQYKETEDSKKKEEKKERKKKFPIPQIAYISRKGPEYLTGHASGDDFTATFGIRGGEFGNWMSDADAQGSLDRCYEAFLDLARVLEINPTDISLNKTLAIGFGSRGHSSAVAHYEPMRQVINLTKYRGQGALCHEWGHALDDAIGRYFGNTIFRGDITPMATDNMGNKDIPESFRNLVKAMKYKTVEKDAAQEKERVKTELEKWEKRYRKSISEWKPSKISEEDSNAWDALVEKAWENRAEVKVDYKKRSFTAFYESAEIEELSSLRKKLSGRVIPKSQRDDIIQNLCYAKSFNNPETVKSSKTQQVYTDFYNGSCHFDNIFTKAGHGYWSSRCEMFARAFDCYISDKLRERGEVSEYLTYGANRFVCEENGKRYAAVPEGEEREELNRLFDELFEDLKKRKFFDKSKEEVA